MSKTKIVVTIGPSSSSEEIIKKMILEGADVFRLNFSHGEHSEKKEIISKIRKIEKELKLNIAILVDLQGPKIRIGKVENEPKIIKEGDIINFTSDETKVKENAYYISYKDFVKDINKDEIILIDDGKIKLKIIEKNEKDLFVKTQALNNGKLFSKKGVNLPSSSTSLPSLTEKDKKDVLFALNHEIDLIALSFVRKAEDIIALREYINSFHKNINIIAKIEKPEGVENIDAIIEASNGIMVARGDLGVEMDFDKVPVIQKLIVRKCIEKSKPVIIATQMMESMIQNFRPTRAEANDVANAVTDGADALMLSGETSIGDYPVETIKAMQDIINFTEKNINSIYYNNHLASKDDDNFLLSALSYNACILAQQCNAKAIIPFTFHGFSALQISSHRPKADIFAFTGNPSIIKTLSFFWGVNTYSAPLFDNIDDAIEYSIDVLLKEGKINNGDIVIHIASTPLRAKDKANLIKISKV